MNRATIRDVARLTGCSTGTFSLALRHSERIRPATRERVLEAAAQEWRRYAMVLAVGLDVDMSLIGMLCSALAMISQAASSMRC